MVIDGNYVHHCGMEYNLVKNKKCIDPHFICNIITKYKIQPNN